MKTQRRNVKVEDDESFCSINLSLPFGFGAALTRTKLFTKLMFPHELGPLMFYLFTFVAFSQHEDDNTTRRASRAAHTFQFKWEAVRARPSKNLFRTFIGKSSFYGQIKP